MYKIGLTGGIASGKSTVSNWLRDHGAPIIDADVAAHRVVEPGQPGLKAVVAEFGDGILQDDGTLNRKALGAIVFGDEPKRQKLNEILHKYIYDYMMAEEAKFEADGEPVPFGRAVGGRRFRFRSPHSQGGLSI